MQQFSKPCGLALLLAATATVSWAAPIGRASHPLIDIGGGYLLGGSASGRWIKPGKIGPALRGGESYRVYGAGGSRGKGKGSRPQTDQAPCQQAFFVKVSSGKGEFALDAPWNATPRLPQVMSPTQPAYVQAVAAYLKQKGLTHPKVKITQAWRVDLEGDGEPEVLLCATNHTSGFSGGGISSGSLAGDYSVVLLRKVVRGEVETIALDGEYYPRAETFNAPNIRTIGGVLDANGDGKLEIILRGSYYEGNWTTVFEMRGEKAVQVLNEGCGA